MVHYFVTSCVMRSKEVKIVRSGNIEFAITPDQARSICETFGEDYSRMSDFEICELLDRLINENTI